MYRGHDIYLIQRGLNFPVKVVDLLTDDPGNAVMGAFLCLGFLPSGRKRGIKYRSAKMAPIRLVLFGAVYGLFWGFEVRAVLAHCRVK